MPRTDLLALEHYAFTYGVTIQARQENSHGHVDHKVFVEMFHDARANVLRYLGVSERDLGDSRTGDVMADLVINYKRESFAFDRLWVDTHLGDVYQRSFRMYFRVRRDADDAVVALGEAGFVTYDYVGRQPVDVPVPLQNAIGALPIDRTITL